MLKLVSWNVNGIRACQQKGGLDNLLAVCRPDILCLQETKAQQDQVELDNLKDYQATWHSAERKGYSGVLILSRQPALSFRVGFSEKIRARFHLEDQFGDSNAEGRLLTLEFADFYLLTVYTPNTKGDLGRLKLRHEAWDPAFLAHCSELDKAKPLLMSGDFNVAHQEIDLARPKENAGQHGFTAEERQGFDNLIHAGFIDTFRHFYPDREQAYSWWTHWRNARAKNVGWRLDYWLASSRLAAGFQSAAILSQVMGSDHCPVSLEIRL